MEQVDIGGLALLGGSLLLLVWALFSPLGR